MDVHGAYGNESIEVRFFQDPPGCFTVDGRPPAPPWMVETCWKPINKTINPSTAFLPHPPWQCMAIMNSWTTNIFAPCRVVLLWAAKKARRRPAPEGCSLILSMGNSPIARGFYGEYVCFFGVEQIPKNWWFQTRFLGYLFLLYNLWACFCRRFQLACALKTQTWDEGPKWRLRRVETANKVCV